MIVQIIKQIANQWRSNLWIMVELFLVFICLYMCFNMLARVADRKMIDTGFDCEHVYKVVYAHIPYYTPAYRPEAGVGESVKEMVQRLRDYPGVEAVGLSERYFYPYGTSYNYRNYYNDTLYTNCNTGHIDPELIRVFRIKGADAQTDLYKEAGQGHVLMTPDAMSDLFGEGVTRGRAYLDKKGNKGKKEYTCVGMTPMYRDEYGRIDKWLVYTHPESYFYKKSYSILEVYLRVRPDAGRDFVDTFFERMKGKLTVGNVAVMGLQSMDDIRTSYLTRTKTLLNIYWAVGLTSFFILCILLGIIGTFWFRTEARTSEIGLRMALGSTRRQVRWQMVGEGLMMFAIVWIPGLLIACLMRDIIVIEQIRAFVPDMSETLFFGLVAGVTTLLMVLLIVAGTWYPARQASKIDPVDALHYE